MVVHTEICDLLLSVQVMGERIAEMAQHAKEAVGLGEHKTDVGVEKPKGGA